MTDLNIYREQYISAKARLECACRLAREGAKVNAPAARREMRSFEAKLDRIASRICDEYGPDAVKSLKLR
jgi:hypothetical protein